ncbi:hypothetical protein [Tychonema sp. LEGE 07203]|uniref:hypothetical protein n=1 Tax=Tychonema sp. LEGE 07203 TaxID=1828671 RepID=UPI0018818533|nr:hypothetical protein [Tychonema sp. LEGE 07203]MBE9096141.1 hypothetical protein [Tychonema sp. LEGE 07203]
MRPTNIVDGGIGIIKSNQQSTLNTQHSTIQFFHPPVNSQLSTLNSQPSTANSQQPTVNCQQSCMSATGIDDIICHNLGILRRKSPIVL